MLKSVNSSNDHHKPFKLNKERVFSVAFRKFHCQHGGVTNLRAYLDLIGGFGWMDFKSPQLLKIQLKANGRIWKFIFKYFHPNEWNIFGYDGFQNPSTKPSIRMTPNCIHTIHTDNCVS